MKKAMRRPLEGPAGKAEKALAKGDDGAYNAYRVAFIGFGGTTFTSGFALADAITANAARRAVATTLLRFAGAEVGAEVVTAEVVAEMAIAVGGFISGAAIVLLLAGLVAAVAAMLLERDDLERWAGGCYFGDDKPDPADVAPKDKKHFTTAAEESAALSAVFWKASTEQEAAQLLARHPAPHRPSDFGQDYTPVANTD